MSRTKGTKNKKKDIYNQVIDIEPIIILQDEESVKVVKNLPKESNDEVRILEFSDGQKYSYTKYKSGSGYVHQYICLTI
jgi:hypothetical protein